MSGGRDGEQFAWNFGAIDQCHANLTAAASKLETRMGEIKSTADRATADWEGAAMAAYQEAISDMRQAGDGLKGMMQGIAKAIEASSPEVRGTDNAIAEMFRK